MIRNPYLKLVGATFSDALAKAINQGANASPAIREVLDQFEGKSIRFELTDFNYQFVLRVEGQTVLIDSESNIPEDVAVQTTLPVLVKLLARGKLDPTILQEVKIVGDVHLIQQFYQIFTNLEFDWEDELSKRIGDIPARQAGNLFRWGKAQASEFRETLQERTRETLVDEHYLVPDHRRIETFVNDVDSLQAKIDRLEKRVERLERQTAE